MRNKHHQSPVRHSSWHEKFILQCITFAVIANGLLIIASTLEIQLRPHGIGIHLDDTLVSLPLVSGLTLVYLGTLLHRRKQAAWAVVIPFYTFIVATNVFQLIHFNLHAPIWFVVRGILLPLGIVLALVHFRRVFTVKSAVQNFTLSLQTIALLFLITFSYGVMGYMLLNQHDFHQQISVSQAVHHTLDQFDFTTNETLTPYSRRATIFVDTLSIMSAVAVGYAIISLFQPLRYKLTVQSGQRELMEELLTQYSDDSDDFFKLWPQDKSYYIDNQLHPPQAALAYRIQSGVALVVAEPTGTTKACERLLKGFDEVCYVNDWLPAYIHISDAHQERYAKLGFQLQKIGEEAVVSIDQFLQTTSKNKYHRQIQNKFNKHGYTYEVLSPPHDAAMLSRLREVSDEWLKIPGRQERGFMMGHFSDDYMQLCNIVVARDSAGTIQAFLNQVTSFKPGEANFDLLRHTSKALGNVNDYVLAAFINHAQAQGSSYVNLGLCPLSGLDKDAEDRNLIDSTLRFVYANGNRFYSFSGLHRFKSKYEPTWSGRYIAYKGGIRGFSRSVLALNKAMSRLK